MRLTPLDLRSHHFGRAWRGYHRDEVDGFLRMVCEDYESLVLEAEGLRKRVRELEDKVGELSAQEQTLRTAVLSVHSVGEDLKRSASREADNLIGEAEVRAEKILDAAHRRLAKLSEDVRQMKFLRTRIAAAVRSTLQTHLAVLDGLLEAPEEEATHANGHNGNGSQAHLAFSPQAVSSLEDA